MPAWGSWFQCRAVAPPVLPMSGACSGGRARWLGGGAPLPGPDRGRAFEQLSCGALSAESVWSLTNNGRPQSSVWGAHEERGRGQPTMLHAKRNGSGQGGGLSGLSRACRVYERDCNQPHMETSRPVSRIVAPCAPLLGWSCERSGRRKSMRGSMERPALHGRRPVLRGYGLSWDGTGCGVTGRWATGDMCTTRRRSPGRRPTG